MSPQMPVPPDQSFRKPDNHILLNYQIEICSQFFSNDSVHETSKVSTAKGNETNLAARYFPVGLGNFLATCLAISLRRCDKSYTNRCVV